MNTDKIDIQQFTSWIKNIAVYLIKVRGSYKYHEGSITEYEDINTIRQYDGYILKEYANYHSNIYRRSFFLKSPKCIPFVCLAGLCGKSNSLYVKSIIENIFPAWTIHNHALGFGNPAISYYDNVNEYYPALKYNTERNQFDLSDYSSSDTPEKIQLNIIKKDLIGKKYACYYRDDIKLSKLYKDIVFKYSIDYLISQGIYWIGYSIFWNIFLLSIDEEVYKNQVSNVISLAQKLNFSEDMIRDWCHAVEYVLKGNILSENCDLQCKTPEGKAFFLHQC